MARDLLRSVRSSGALIALAPGFLVVSAAAMGAGPKAEGSLSPLKAGWTAAGVAAETAGCQSGVRADAWATYLKSNQLDERKLPADAKEQFEQSIGPLLVTCSCLTETMAREFSTKDYVGRTAAAVSRVEALLGKDGACAAPVHPTSGEPTTSGCVRFYPDPKGFPYPSIREAKSALTGLKREGGETMDFVVWSYYTDSEGVLAADVYELPSNSPFGSALVWRRPEWGEVDRMLFSSLCEGNAEQCAAFDRWVQDTQPTTTIGECLDETKPG